LALHKPAAQHAQGNYLGGVVGRYSGDSAVQPELKRRTQMVTTLKWGRVPLSVAVLVAVFMIVKPAWS